jgi:hypothetical protein
MWRVRYLEWWTSVSHWLVRLGGYIVNLCVFYFSKLIGKLTVFLQIQEFSLWNVTVTSFTTVAWCSPHSSNLDWEYSHQDYITTDYFEYRRRTCGVQITHSPITLANLSPINLVSIFRCSSPPCNPVYSRRVDPSGLAFSLSSHRHSYIILLFIFHFID